MGRRLRPELDDASAEVEARHPLDRMRRRSESHVGPPPIGLPRRIRPPGREPRTLVALEMAGDALVAVDRGIRRRTGAEHLVAEGVVEVRVGVDDPAHAGVEPRLDVGEELFGLGRLRTRVDDEQPVVAFDDDDREVERP